MDLDKLAESFSSDVINEAISEIAAEEDLKPVDGQQWYRKSQVITPTRPLAGGFTKEGSTASDCISQCEISSSASSPPDFIARGGNSGILEKVSPIRTPMDRLSPHAHTDINNSDEPIPPELLPTSHVLKDVPGYMSPNTRSRILSGERFTGAVASESRSDEMFRTMVQDDEQHTVIEQEEEIPVTRKSSTSSFYSGKGDRSSRSNISRQQSEGSTVYNSLAPEAFGHKGHLSPLLDMSIRSSTLEATLPEPPNKSRNMSNVSSNSSKSTPRVEARSHNSSRYQPSPREQNSRISSTTEYDALPNSIHNSKLSPNISAQLMLSPDLAQRVSAILGHSPEAVPKLSLLEESPKTRLSLDSGKGSPHSIGSSGSVISQDELDRHVSDVLSRSEHFLESQGRLRETAPVIPLPRGDNEDRSYLDKYMSPRYVSPNQRYTSPNQRYTSGRDSSSQREDSSPGLEYSRYASPRLTTGRPRTNTQEEITPRTNSSQDRYMDKSSRDILDQAAKEYYRDLRRTKSTADESATHNRGHNRGDTSVMTNTSEVHEELVHLVDRSSPPPTNISRHSAKPYATTSHLHRPAKLPTAAISEAETQSLVAKRLDRIEFMVLSALNEVPPQHKSSYPDPATIPLPLEVVDQSDYNVHAAVNASPPIDEGIYEEDMRDAIKTSDPKSPLGCLPDYQMGEYLGLSRNSTIEESFNVGISPVKRDPFTAFTKAQALLSERLAQMSNDRTPGRRVSTRSYRSPLSSPARSPTRDGQRPYPHPDARDEARSRDKALRSLENIPEPRPLEIVGAGPTPSNELPRRTKGRRSSLSSVDSAVTTVESSHPESDDAQAPELPREALGSRLDPANPTTERFGLRRTHSPRSTDSVSPRDAVENLRSTQREARHSAVGRAEHALLRGNEIRERMLARREERKAKQATIEDVNPVVELLNSPPRDLPSPQPLESPPSEPVNQPSGPVNQPSEPVTQPSERAAGGQGAPIDEREKIYKPANSADHNMEKSVLLDFYTPPRSRKPTTASRREDNSKQKAQAWVDEQPVEPCSSDSDGDSSLRKLQRANRLRDSSLERVAALKKRAEERALQKNSVHPRSISPDQPKLSDLIRSHGQSRRKSPEHTSGRELSVERQPLSPERPRSQERPRSLDRSRPRERLNSAELQRSREKSRERLISHERQRSLERSRERQRPRSRERLRSRERQRSLERSRERQRSRSRQRLRSRERQRSLERSRSKERLMLSEHQRCMEIKKLQDKLRLLERPPSWDRSSPRERLRSLDRQLIRERKESLERRGLRERSYSGERQSRGTCSPNVSLGRGGSPVAGRRSPSPHYSTGLESLSPTTVAPRRGQQPLERADQPETQYLKSKLSHAVHDRLMTYHILREELMKTEDEVRGRELNLAWQRISKRKVNTPSVLEEEGTLTTNTSTVSSEGFDEQRMEKLRSLLNNPLGHLVSKAMKTKPSADKTKTSSRSTGKTVKPSKYDKLMAKIQQQKNEESLLKETFESGAATSAEDTVCSRCEEKRLVKRSLKQHKKKKEDVGARESASNSSTQSTDSSTRPVTPTGLLLPLINQRNSNMQDRNFNNNRSQGDKFNAVPKRLVDAGVMCPSPTIQIKSPSLRDRSKSPPPNHKASLAWCVDGNEGHNSKGQQRNAFQKSRDVDQAGQEGLVWFVKFNNPRPWTKEPLQRQSLSVAKEPWVPNNRNVQTASERRGINDICEAFNEATGRTNYTPSLQEAFRERNQRFVSASRQRQRKIKLRSDERQINKVHDEQRAQLFDIQPYTKRSSRSAAGPKSIPSSKRAIPKDEMYNRTSRVYRILPEVKNKQKNDGVQRERLAYRLKAKLFNKKVQRHVLDQARVTHLVANNKPATGPAHSRG